MLGRQIERMARDHCRVGSSEKDKIGDNGD